LIPAELSAANDLKRRGTAATQAEEAAAATAASSSAKQWIKQAVAAEWQYLQQKRGQQRSICHQMHSLKQNFVLTTGTNNMLDARCWRVFGGVPLPPDAIAHVAHK
jgi:hypothetical protein